VRPEGLGTLKKCIVASSGIEPRDLLPCRTVPQPTASVAAGKQFPDYAAANSGETSSMSPLSAKRQTDRQPRAKSRALVVVSKCGAAVPVAEPVYVSQRPAALTHFGLPARDVTPPAGQGATPEFHSVYKRTGPPLDTDSHCTYSMAYSVSAHTKCRVTCKELDCEGVNWLNSLVICRLGFI
jgi:hypothetical protein